MKKWRLIIWACFVGFCFNIQAVNAKVIFGDSINVSDTSKTEIIWLLKKVNHTKNPKIRWTGFPAFNDNDGIMSGIIATNEAEDQDNQISYVIAPMYSFKQKSMTGQAVIKFNIFRPSPKVNKFSVGMGIKSFHFNQNEKFSYSLRYLRINPEASLYFEHSKENRSSGFRLTTFFISEDLPIFETGNFTGLAKDKFFIPRLDYFYRDHDEYQGTDINITSEYQHYRDEYYLKLTGIADKKYRFSEKKYLYFRGFVSGFLTNTQRKSSSFQNVFTRGSIALIHQGFNDYTYDETFLSRQNQSGFQNDQVSVSSGGGFKTPAGSAFSIGMSNHFAASLNIMTEVPIRLPEWIPLRIYFDIGTYTTYTSNAFVNNMMYNGGLSLHYKDILNVYLPLVYSDNLESVYAAEHMSFLSKISFSINFNKIELRRLPNNIF